MTMKNVFNLMVGLGLSLAVIACSQDDDTTPATLGFTTTTATGAEDAGKQTITISLSKAVTTDTEITFALGGTASLNGD